MPAQAHTRAELDEWVENWVVEADNSFSPTMAAEFEDMTARHPYYFDPQPSRPRGPFTPSWSGSVEQWRPLVTEYFGDLADHAMCVLTHESGGNPNAYNSSSGASGLFQHLPKYWSARSAKAGWAGASIMDPRANVAVAEWLQRTGGWGHWTVNWRC